MTELRYRVRVVTAEDVLYIRELIAAHPRASRRRLSQKLCEPVYFAETFIDPGRFRGTCYRAANWKFLGLTTGRGKNDHTYKPNRPIKEVLGLPLTPHFRELLTQ